MRSILRGSALLTAVLLTALSTAPAGAVAHYGDTAPDFMKTQFNTSPAVTQSLNSFPYKIRVYFLFGYNCPFCLNDGPSFQTNVNQFYQTTQPGAVQCVGFDLYNGTPAQVGSFQAQTGASYPLTLNGASATGGNMSTLYGPFDNYVIVDKLGIVRYHAADRWPHGNRYHLNELRGVIDSLLAAQTGVEESVPPEERYQLANAPNPFSNATQIQLVNPGNAARLARIDVVDALGRRVATIFEGMARPGVTTFSWSGQYSGAGPAASGLYFLRGEIGGRVITQRIVRAR